MDSISFLPRMEIFKITKITWSVVLVVCIQQSLAQPTTLGDVTLCSDIRNYNTIIRTLDVVTKETKSLRAALKSMQNSYTSFAHTFLDQQRPNMTSFMDTIKHGFINNEHFDSGLEGVVRRMTSHIDGVEHRLDAKISLLGSAVKNHDDRVTLSSKMFKFYVSRQFTSLEDSGKSSFGKAEQQIENLNQVVLQNLNSLSRNISLLINQTSRESNEFLNQTVSMGIARARVAMEAEIAEANRSLSRDISTVTTTTLDALINIKDILNHHHVTTRLAGGTSALNGRVEVFLNGVWGTVCDDGWDDVDAGVVCKKLGFCNGTAKSRGFYGAGTGPVVLDNVECRGHEVELFDCPHNGIGIENCNRFEDAAVQCAQC